ncbi:MAG TPA: hypothetical protein VGB98_18415 [Pyrinomonadaceae bacterium]|jgi:hypothetical protein
MLDKLFGVNVILWAGATIPRPAPELSAALTGVEVTNDAAEGDGFQLTFTLAKNRVGEYGLLQRGALDVFNRVIIGVMIGAMPSALIDGIVTHHEVAPSNEPGMSTLTVKGRDLSVLLGLKQRDEAYQNQPDFLIVTRLIASYAQYGLVPRVTPTTDVPIFLDRIPRQTAETDLQVIRRLAEKNGFVFYVEPLTFGVNTAYWGPASRLGLPQSALTVDMGSHTNVRRLSFGNDALAPVAAEGTFTEPFTGMSIPIPALPSLRVPPLAASAGQARRTVRLSDTANRGPIQAALGALARATNAPDAVEGTGELDSIRYGGVLRARRLVGVRGAGFSYDGFYYVRRVTHRFTKEDYTQSFTISREGTGTLLPVVIP